MKIYGKHEQKTIDQFSDCYTQPSAVHGALMPDGHFGYGYPVGGVMAYRNAISVNGVGVDIACGNKAIKTSLRLSDLGNIESLADVIFRSLSFGVGRNNNEKVYHDVLDRPEFDSLPCLQGMKDNAAKQLGTIGAGNHFCDIFVDESGFVWIGVHFGSRGLGHKVATWFFTSSNTKDGQELVLSVDSDLGDQYIKALDVVGQYAYAGRDWVCNKVHSIIGGDILDSVHNHHNFAWLENHFGEDLWVVRKGSTPAFPGQRGFVGGSMGDISVILHGVETSESANMLYSTVHGAGRVMGRIEASGMSRGKKVREGKVTPEMMYKWMHDKGIVLRGSDVDESPFVYRRLPDVLNDLGGTVEIEHTLTPIIVMMAKSDVTDPFKD